MSRHSKAAVDPQALERIRAVRAAEDAAVAEVFHHVGLVQAAQRRRAQALGALDADVRRAEEALAGAQGALVTVAGLQRAAAMLDVTVTALRKCAAATGQRSRPASPDTAGSVRQEGE